MLRLRVWTRVAGLVVTSGVLLAGHALAQQEEEKQAPGERPTLRVTPLTSDFRFDGILSEPLWLTADSIANLVTIEPEEGGDPAGRTVIRVLVSAYEIVVGVFCADTNPRGIVSFSKARDSDLEEEDHVVIVFDTFQDARSGYVFAVNPSGARFDGLVTQGEDVNSDWDAIWEAKTSRDQTGWSAEIRIPIKSISFGKGLANWGFNVQRRVQRLQETSRWAGASRDYEIHQTSQAGLLAELPSFDLGLGLSIRPSLAGEAVEVARVDPEFDGDISLDVTQRLGPNMLSAVTVNTDFAETEVDVRQINLTRFPLFFPEKRTFFLEGADIFEFGPGLDEEKLVPFFSRRIGLLGLGEEDQSEIPINVGGKINGRVGNTNVGALVVNTRKVDSLPVAEDVAVSVPTSTMGAVRIKQNVLEQSSVGLIATAGDQQGRSGAWTAGVDLAFQTSSFLGDKNFLIGIWGLLNDRDGLEGDRAAYGFRIDYPNDLISLDLTSLRLGDGFDPSLGFMPRNNVHIWEFSGDYSPRPGWALVRQMFFNVAGLLYNELDNSTWESYEATIKPFDWLLESGDRLEFRIKPQGDRPPEDFEIADEVVIPIGSYNWTRFSVGARAAEKRPVSGEITWESGGYYSGDLSTIEATLALKPSALLTVELTGERNTGKVTALADTIGTLEEREFTEQLFGLRLLVNLSPDLQVISFTQYDTESGALGTNNRLRWTFHPLGDLFLVYNHDAERTTDKRWEFLSRQGAVKIQYAWRF